MTFTTTLNVDETVNVVYHSEDSRIPLGGHTYMSFLSTEKTGPGSEPRNDDAFLLSEADPDFSYSYIISLASS